MADLSEGSTVLIVFNSAHTPNDIQEIVERIKNKVGGHGKVVLEHAERLLLGK